MKTLKQYLESMGWEYTRSGKQPIVHNSQTVEQYSIEKMESIIDEQNAKGVPTLKIIENLMQHGLAYLSREDAKRLRIRAGEKYDANGKYIGRRE
jgi:hypothetical protein